MSGNNHLTRRKGVYYYRRRVPAQLVKPIGSKVIQLSLGTTSLKEAKKLRTAKDLEWDVRFETCTKALASSDTGSLASPSSSKAPPLSEPEMIRLVHDYVERMDERSRRRFAADPPQNEKEKREMIIEAGEDSQIMRDRDDLRADMMISQVGDEILKQAGKTFHDAAIPQGFWGWVRRGLLELDSRRLARLRDDHGQAFFDQLFNPSRPPEVSFGELADQFLQLTEEEAAPTVPAKNGSIR